MKMDFGTLSNDMVRLRDGPETFMRAQIADVNWKNENGKTLFMFALANCTPLPDMAVRYGVHLANNLTYIIAHRDFDPNIQDNVGRTALMYFVDRYGNNGIPKDFSLAISSDMNYFRVQYKLAVNPKYNHSLKCNDGKFTYQYDKTESNTCFELFSKCMIHIQQSEITSLKKDVAELNMMVRQLWMAPGMPGAVMGTEWKAMRKNSF